MNKGRKRKADIPQPRRVSDTSRYVVPAVFVFIAAVYIISLAVIFPDMPITTRQADTIPGYDRYYPPFRTDEYNYYDIAKNILGGKLYEEGSFERAYPLGFSLVAAPFIAVFDTSGGYAANVVIMLLSLWLYYCIIRRYGGRMHLNRGTSSLIALLLIMAFATLNWFYAVSCYSEPLAQLLTVLAMYLIIRGRDSSRNAPDAADGAEQPYSPGAHRTLRLAQRKGACFFFVAAGIATGLNLFVRPHYILLALPFFISLLISGAPRLSLKNSGFLYVFGVAAVILVWLVRNSLVFGSPLSFEYTRMLGQFVPGGINEGVKGNVFTGTHRLLFDEFHGLLTITPILLVFPAGLHRMWQRGLRNESITLLVSVIMMILVFGSGPYPFTEFGLGSRHMVPMYPLMMIPAVFFLDELLFSRSVILVLALYSFYHAGIGWFTGTYPGIGYFPGFLNDSHARAIILARKGVLPKRTFKTSEALLKAHIKSLNDFDMHTFLQTLDPKVVKAIQGRERDFLLYWRFNQGELRSKIKSIDPERGIEYESFSFVEPGGTSAPPPESQNNGP